jgi:AhpD family alkylhydroperoxidase
MDEKLKELIAIGAATTANCIPCLKFHHEKASGVGATVDEINEAIEVGRMVRRGAARAWDKETEKLLDGTEEAKR